jgi:hypothetical protein
MLNGEMERRALRLVLVAAAVLAGCGSLPVPAGYIPIYVERSGRHTWYSKGGVPIDGFTCGERYRQAVDEEPAAVALVGRCRRENIAYAVLLIAAFVPPALGLAAAGSDAFDEATRHGLGIGGFALGLVTFGAGMLVGYLGGVDLRQAIQLYNGPAQAPPAGHPSPGAP